MNAEGQHGWQQEQRGGEQSIPSIEGNAGVSEADFFGIGYSKRSQPFHQ